MWRHQGLFRLLFLLAIVTDSEVAGPRRDAEFVMDWQKKVVMVARRAIQRTVEVDMTIKVHSGISHLRDSHGSLVVQLNMEIAQNC